MNAIPAHFLQRWEERGDPRLPAEVVAAAAAHAHKVGGTDMLQFVCVGQNPGTAFWRLCLGTADENLYLLLNARGRPVTVYTAAQMAGFKATRKQHGKLMRRSTKNNKRKLNRRS